MTTSIEQNFIGPGKAFKDANAFNDWINSTPANEVAAIAKQYGVTNQDIAEQYSAPDGSTFSASQVGNYLGNNPAPATTPAITPAPTGNKLIDGSIGPGKTWATTKDFSDWVNTQSPENIAQLAQDYGISNQDIADAYTAPDGSTFTAAQVQNYLTSTPQLWDPSKYSQSYSGLGKQNTKDLIANIFPELFSSVKNFKSNVDSSLNKSLGFNAQMGQDLLKPLMQSSINSLASKGILNSSIASNAMGNVSKGLLEKVQNQNLQAGIAASKIKAGEPSMLGQLLNSTKYTQQSDPGEAIRNFLLAF